MNILTLLLLLIPLWYVFDYFATILQQQYYENSRFLTWILQNFKKWLLTFGPIIIVVCLETIAINFVTWLTLVFAATNTVVGGALVYLRQRTLGLKYTKRILRLFLCYFVINIILLSLCLGLFDILWTFTLGVTLLIFAPWLLILTNAIVKPLESHINQKYLDQAKSRLDQRPDLITVGITGSYGKTTLKYILLELIDDSFYTLYSKNSINTPLGLSRIIREDLQIAHQVFLAEMGVDRPGGMDKLLEVIRPQIAIVNSIGKQHLATFKSLDNIKSEKIKLLQSLGENDNVVINADEPLLEGDLGIKARRLYYSVESPSNLQAINVSYSNSGLSFDLLVNGVKDQGWKSRLLGEHNLYNLLGAISIALLLEVPLERIKANLATLTPFKHRLEPIIVGERLVIDDSYNSNPVGFRSALKVLASFPTYRVVITPGLVEQGDEWYQANYDLGQPLATSCDLVLLVNKKNVKPIVDAFKALEFNNYRVVDRFAQAKEIVDQLAIGPMTILIENDLPEGFIS